MSDKMAATVAARLAERDASGGDWQDDKAPSRDEADSDARADAVSRRDTVQEAYSGTLNRTERRAEDDPDAPPAPDPDATLRDELRNVIAWQKAPRGKRRALAAAAAEFEKAKALGTSLGIEVKTPADAEAVLKRAQAEGEGGQAPADALPEGDAEAQALAFYRTKAEQSGSTLPQALERYTAAEDFLARDPHNALRWLCANFNVTPAELDPELNPYAQAAERVGLSLPGMVERYTAAERLLDSDPAAGIRYLCRHYGIDPRSLA